MLNINLNYLYAPWASLEIAYPIGVGLNGKCTNRVWETDIGAGVSPSAYHHWSTHHYSYMCIVCVTSVFSCMIHKTSLIWWSITLIQPIKYHLQVPHRSLAYFGPCYINIHERALQGVRRFSTNETMKTKKIKLCELTSDDRRSGWRPRRCHSPHKRD